VFSHYRCINIISFVIFLWKIDLGTEMKNAVELLDYIRPKLYPTRFFIKYAPKPRDRAYDFPRWNCKHRDLLSRC